MTSGKTVILILAIIAATAIIVQEEYQTSTLRIRAQKLEQQFDRLKSERDRMASELTALRNENDQLNRKTFELSKLRAEVVQLKSKYRVDPRPRSGSKNSFSKITSQVETADEASLDGQQKKPKHLADFWTEKLETGNSVEDLERLQDSLNRWNELFVDPAPPELKPVFLILEQRVRDHLAELEKSEISKE